ncbi:penicillin acylase family protein [Roseomonas marmotae]|uniref:Penicillin acylase family protein n=1 Tax=Roseomonas marmotae TaxID=2768161 RepID=A0ABS3KAF3_9PROT|nr:penicillin acylase family protein [Roseomonas marmotae]MBO1074446.1 penicillin acylase family protein [Roseomonas marmotae]QTI78183.1 penicillin acylase family protein [Roseomonas marmotae]
MQRRPGRFRRFFLRGLIWAAALVVLASAGTAALLWATMPQKEGKLALRGLSAPVEILQDEHGIPRITAATELDAAVALGWLHARDRMFQMEMMRRGASGRLAELAGPAALRMDRFSRTLGLARSARADYQALPEPTRAMLEAYARGMNAWIEARGRLAAPEFLVFGVPEPWEPWQSLLWAKVMGLWLSGNWRLELDRARLAGLLPPERLAELWPADESAGRPDLAALPSTDSLTRLAAAVPEFPLDAPLPSSASNAWAVAASRSVTGGALLASDPHLGFQAPILWYLARIEIAAVASQPSRFLAGATSPGVPFMVIGRNEKLAWGFTTTHSDTQDVFIERPAGSGSYQSPDGPRMFAEREETIRIRGQEPEILRVRETRHGPVISDLDGTTRGENLLAVAMANLAEADTAAAGLHALNRAGNLAEARAAAAQITSPAQNLMVAAPDGIALYLTGRAPLRSAGDGTQPAPGWDGSHDWIGWVPFDEMPHAENPPGGVLVNANNRVQPAGVEPYLGRDWFGDWRFRRIHALLAQRDQHSPQEMAMLQRDELSLFAQELLPALRAIPRPSGPAGAARDLLLGWDGEMRGDAPQPLIFNAWWPLAARMALDRGGVPAGAWPSTPEFLTFVLGPQGRGAHWCQATGEADTSEDRPVNGRAPILTEACAALVAEALQQATARLLEQHGPDLNAWRWDQAHHARFEHPLLRFLPVLGRWTRVEIPTGGDDQTVNRGGMAGRGFAHVHGPGLRAVFDLSAPAGVAAVIGTGQSGHPLSRHWADQTPIWAGRAPDGALLLPLGPVPGQSSGVLRLEPG